jgi:hypothetical protein
VLRELFRDTRLAEVMMPHADRAFVLTVQGFASPDWAVRNAFTILLGSLTHRMLGMKLTAEEGARANTVGVAEFFRRFPATEPFLLVQLQAAAEVVASTGSASLQPQLFAALTVLGRLCVDWCDEPAALQAAEQRTTTFGSALFALTQSRVLAMRQLAARALVAFIPLRPQCTEDRVSVLFGTLNPFMPDKRLRAAARVVGKQNALHGALLMVRAVLVDTLPSMSEFSQHIICKELMDYTSLGDSAYNPCATTRREYWLLWTCMLATSLPSHWFDDDTIGFVLAREMKIIASSRLVPDHMRLLTTLLDLVLPRHFRGVREYKVASVPLLDAIVAVGDTNLIVHTAALLRRELVTAYNAVRFSWLPAWVSFALFAALVRLVVFYVRGVVYKPFNF